MGQGPDTVYVSCITFLFRPMVVIVVEYNLLSMSCMDSKSLRLYSEWVVEVAQAMGLPYYAGYL